MIQILYLTRHLSLPGSHVFLFSVSFFPSTRKITSLLFGKLSEHCRALRQRLLRTKVPIIMALNVGSSCLCGFNTRRREIVRVRAVASEDLAPSMTKEEKVKLGGSDLKVTRLGIGAWSWGDTSYWNNFEWDECWSYGASYHPLTWMPCMHEVLSVPTCIACPRTPKSLKPTAAPKKGFPQLMSLLQFKALRTIVVLDHKQQPGAVGAQTVFDISDRKMKAAKAAFDASVDGGITFFDTAEVYGSRFSLGAINSETLLGRFIKERKEKDPEVEVAVATKFAALPWRLGRQSVLTALKDSLCRLGLSSVELYQLHWPGVWGNEGYIDGLGDAVEQGLVKAVGVSNYSERRLRDAYERLKKRGIPLASNQVNYSLIYRAPEENGVKAACDELGITLIAYSPIAQGVLTGKYKPENPPSGPRGRIYTPEFLTKLQPLLNRIQTIGDNCGKTPTQVVLNWLIARDNVVPIPGAKNAEQAKEFAGALGWRLSNEEINELGSVASDIKPVVGFPVEKL